MPSWKDILEQVAVIRTAPIPFGMVTIAIFGIVWVAVNWSYSSVLDELSLNLGDGRVRRQRLELSA